MKKPFLILFILSIGLIAKAQKTDTIKATSDTVVFVAADSVPNFPGGLSKFYEYESKNVRYPGKAFMNHKEGKVFVQFIIEKDGSITHPIVIRKVYPDLDKEAIRIISLSPKWNPALVDGKPIRFQYVIPITFYIGSQVYHQD